VEELERTQRRIAAEQGGGDSDRLQWGGGGESGGEQQASGGAGRPWIGEFDPISLEPLDDLRWVSLMRASH
jgi:hypothetical protein